MRLQRLRRNIGCGKYICYRRKKDGPKYCIARKQSKCATREVIEKYEMDLARDIDEQKKTFLN